MLTLKVDGYVEAKRIMDQLPNNMQKRMLLTALRTSAQPMLRTAKGRVPVRTGRLRRQLRIVRFRDRNAPGRRWMLPSSRSSNVPSERAP